MTLVATSREPIGVAGEVSWRVPSLSLADEAIRGDAQTIALAPLRDSETAALITGLLGPDPSVDGLGQTIAERVAGFFAEEIVRELADRGVLHGQAGRIPIDDRGR